MDALYTYLLQVAIGSGTLVGVYILLLEKRVSFRASRTYLLVTTLFAAIIPLIKIPVWSASDAQVAVQIGVGMPTATILADEGAVISWFQIIGTIWVIGTLILSSSMLRQVVKIHALRRSARRTSVSGYTVAYTQEQIGSFSFLRTVYLWDGTPLPQQRHIIAHEASHIRHRHTCERLVMETLKTLLWWNPFVWIASRKLIEVHEFEADRDVLGQGYIASDYADTIFGQIFGYNPDITNGLHDSLTKKRLQMMTTNTKGRHDLLRLAATLPVIVGLLCAFSFTTRAANTTEHSAPESPETAQKSTIQNNQQVTVTRNADGTVSLMSHSTNQNADGTANPTYTLASHVMIPSSSNEAGNSSDMQTYEVTSIQNKDKTDDEPFLVVEQMPRFQDGELNTFRLWVQSQVTYPVEALKQNIQGRVVVSFVIGRNGSLGDIQILQSPDEVLGNEAIRILKTSPKWTPGTQRGETVRVKYTLPIDFRLPDEKAE